MDPGVVFMPWLRSCQFLTCDIILYVLKLLSGLCLVDSVVKKACSTQVETNQGHLYAHCTATHSASRAYHSALAQVVLPAYIIAPVKIHAELEKVLLIHVTVC